MKQFSTKHIFVDREKCKACWRCHDGCLKQVFGKINVLGIHKHVYVKNAAARVGCLKCVKICPHGAITPVIKP